VCALFGGGLRPLWLAAGGGAARWSFAGYLFLVPGTLGCLPPSYSSSIARGIPAKEGAVVGGGPRRNKVECPLCPEQSCSPMNLASRIALFDSSGPVVFKSLRAVAMDNQGRVACNDGLNSSRGYFVRANKKK